MSSFRRPDRDKARFIQDGVIRVMPEPERLNALVDRLETLWDGLTERGYGNAFRAQVDAQVQARAEPEATKPAPAADPRLAQRLELVNQLGYARRILEYRPDNEELREAVAAAARALRNFDGR